MKAIFLTLAHSLWLGAVMAFLAGLVIVFTKKSGPKLRYKLLTMLFVVFIISEASMFCNQLINSSNNTIAKNNILPLEYAAIKFPQIQEQKSLMDIFISFVQEYANIIVMTWLIVICFKCVQLLSGLQSLHRLKKRNISEAGKYWNERMNELATKVGITKTVLLLQSSLAKVPMVIGQLKPVILFPVGILNALPQNEVEAILLHELAHIKRNDFIINLLQQFVEIVFFFNPAVLWVSSLIKNERENCCDDIAIDVTQDKKMFIHALVAFQEYNAGLSYTTTFAGQKNHLLNRVKRIITNNNKTLNNMEKLILASGIILTCLATVAFSPKQTIDKKENTTTVNEAKKQTITENAEVVEGSKTQTTENSIGDITNYNDTLPEKSTIPDSLHNMDFNGEVDGKKIRLKEENGQINELYIDGTKIPEGQYDQYKPLIDKIHQQAKEKIKQLKLKEAQLGLQKEEMQKQSALMQKEVEKMKEQSELMKKDIPHQQELMKQKQVEMQKEVEVMKKNEVEMKIQSQKMQQDFMKKQEDFKLKQIEFEKKVEQLKLQQQKMKEMLRDSAKVAVVVKPSLTVTKAIPAISKLSMQSETLVKPTVIVMQNGKSVSTLKLKPPVIVTTAVVAKPAVYVTATSISERIINDLKEANIISTSTNISFRLTNKELIVNGVKQPEDIHQKILKKYLSGPNDTISFSYSNQQ